MALDVALKETREGEFLFGGLASGTPFAPPVRRRLRAGQRPDLADLLCHWMAEPPAERTDLDKPTQPGSLLNVLL